MAALYKVCPICNAKHKNRSEACARPACQKENNRRRRAEQRADQKSLRKKMDHSLLCICGCGYPRMQNRWYSPWCDKWKNAGEIIGGTTRHNGKTVSGGKR